MSLELVTIKSTQDEKKLERVVSDLKRAFDDKGIGDRSHKEEIEFRANLTKIAEQERDEALSDRE